MNWKSYQNKVLPILKEYRNDYFPSKIENVKILEQYLKSIFNKNEEIHNIVLELIYEKPIKEDLDNMINDGLKHEYDQLIEIIDNANSFNEANKLAKELWDA